MARTPKSPTPVAEAKKPEVSPAVAAVTPKPKPKATAPGGFEVVDGMGKVVGIADTQEEADEVIADFRAAGRGPSHVRPRGAQEPEADAEAAGE